MTQQLHTPTDHTPNINLIYTVRNAHSHEVAVLLSRVPTRPEHPELGFGSFNAITPPQHLGSDLASKAEQHLIAMTGIRPEHPLTPQLLGTVEIEKQPHQFIHIPLEGSYPNLPKDYVQNSNQLLAWVRDYQWRYDVSKETMGATLPHPRYFVMTHDGEVDVTECHATFIHNAMMRVQRSLEDNLPLSILESTHDERTREPLVPVQQIHRMVA
ncbi:MAG: hypothetical protein EAY65_02200 [Alphaproteobacteria bacterium]|nr:MAG: hypothetical protein EAY65_02200 [Alphaproteobacteria bacterium]